MTHRFGVTFLLAGLIPNPLDIRFTEISGLGAKITTTNDPCSAPTLSASKIPTGIEYNELTLRRGFVLGPSERVLVVEDVVTTGGSALKAVRQLRQAGFVVERVVAIVDRQEGGAAAMAAAGLELRSLFQLEEVAAAQAGAAGADVAVDVAAQPPSDG